MIALMLSMRSAQKKIKSIFCLMNQKSRSQTLILGLGVFMLLLGSCSSIKRNEKQLAQGNYDQVVNSI